MNFQHFGNRSRLAFERKIFDFMYKVTAPKIYLHDNLDAADSQPALENANTIENKVNFDAKIMTAKCAPLHVRTVFRFRFLSSAQLSCSSYAKAKANARKISIRIHKTMA